MHYYYYHYCICFCYGSAGPGEFESCLESIETPSSAEDFDDHRHFRPHLKPTKRD